VVPDVPEKSVGAEETFAHDVADRPVLRRELLRLVERATGALRGRGLRGRTVALKIRYPDFTTITRSRTLAEPTDSAHEVFAVAGELLDGSLPGGVAVRLLGVRVEQLVGGVVAEQLTLDGSRGKLGGNVGGHWRANPTTANWPDAERAADAARSRFGRAAVQPATLFDTPNYGHSRSGRGAAQLSPESGNRFG
jgi:DNA polymerase-4